MSGVEFQVTLRDTDLVVTDQVTYDPRRIDIVLSDVIAIADRVLFPRSLSIVSVTPGRGRNTDQLTIKGTGFATSIAGNRVLFGNSFSGTIISASEDTLVVIAPFFVSFLGGGFTGVDVQSPPFSIRTASRNWYAKEAADDLADRVDPTEQAGPGEDPGVDRPRYAEATDWNRLMEVVDLVLGDGAQAGSMVAGDGVGPAAVVNRNLVDGLPGTTDQNGNGQLLVVDPSQPTGLALGWLTDVTLPFGGQVVANPGGAVKLRAHGDQLAATGANSAHGALLDGTLDLVWLLVKEGSTDTLDRVRVLVNAAQVYDSGAGLVLVNNQVHSARLGVAVLKTDQVEVEVTKAGTAATMRLVGGVRLEPR